MIDFHKLSAPFPPSRVSWRVGSTTQDKKKGMALAYCDARDVMERLDEVCGPGGWQCAYPHATGKTVCAIGIKVGDEWVWKSDGAGDTDIEAEKGALSDAFKRAAVRWGVGRYLYEVVSPWVDLEQAGKSYKIKDSELTRLSRLLTGAAPETKTADTPPPTPEPPKTNGHTNGGKSVQQARDEITACRTRAEIKAWQEANKDWLARLSDASTVKYDDLMIHIDGQCSLLSASAP